MIRKLVELVLVLAVVLAPGHALAMTRAHASPLAVANSKTRVGGFEQESAKNASALLVACVRNASGKIVCAPAKRIRLSHQGRWYSGAAGGIYDFRNRWWSPELGAFLSPDEFDFITKNSTLWSWPGQNPFANADPTGQQAEPEDPRAPLVSILTLLGFGDTATVVVEHQNALDAIVRGDVASAECSAHNILEASASLAVGAVSVAALKINLLGRSAGQQHHAISKKVHAALERHPVLAGEYSSRDPRFVTQAVDKAAHSGYQEWHRALDREVVQWIESNPNASTADFESYLRALYNTRPDLINRFPGGL